MGQKTIAKPCVNISTRIGWAAVLCAVAAGILLIAQSLWQGATLPQSVARGAVSAVFGLLAWMSCYSICRRHTSLCVIGFTSCAQFNQTPMDFTFGPQLWCDLLFGIISGGFIGLVYRLVQARVGGAKSIDPLDDPIMDEPAR